VQADIWQTIQAWAIALVLYPGAVFAALVVLLGEWLSGTLRPLFSPRSYRSQARLYSFLQPMYTFLKLSGRQGAVRWQGPREYTGEDPTAPSHPGETALAVLGAIAPLLVLGLLPVAGNRIGRELGPVGDIVIILLLLAVQPISGAVLRLREGGLATLDGARDLGRLLAGLLPTLLLVAALIEVSDTHSLVVANLTAAPLTPQQTFVRLLAGMALLIALPWWTARDNEHLGEERSAAAYAGNLLQRVALAAFWAVIVLPRPGEMPWAVALFIASTLFAYAALKTISQRWTPTRRQGESTGLVWLTTLPAAALALLLALWPTT
jgi:hypothetical protein